MSYRARSHRDRNHAPIQKALERAGCRVADLSKAGGGVSDLLVFRPATGLLLPLEVKVLETAKKTSKTDPTEIAQQEFRRRFPMTRVVTSIAEAFDAMGIEAPF